MGAPVGFLVTQASTALLVVLGVFLVWVRPRRRGTVAFGVSSIALGAVLFLQNFVYVGSVEHAIATIPAWGAVALALLWGAAGGGLAVAAVSLPRGLDARERRWVAAVSIIPVFLALAYLAGMITILADSDRGAWEVTALAANVTTAGFSVGVFLAAGILFALRYRASSPSAHRDRVHLALLTAGVVPYMAISGGIGILDPHLAPLGAIILTIVALNTILWLTAAHRQTDARIARNVALLMPASVLTGMIASRLAGGFFALDATGFFGLVRLASFALVAYSVLRHHLFDIDLKVRWTLHRGTVLALVGTVFFLLEEGAEYVLAVDGLLPNVAAAAAIGMAAMPMWRLAGRLTGRLMPGVEDTDAYRSARRREMFEAAVESASGAGRPTPLDEAALTVLAGRLGLDPRETRLALRGLGQDG